MRLITSDIQGHFSKSKSAATVKTSHMGASIKTAAGSSTDMMGYGGNTLFTQPMFFSPLHTPQNWQIPSKRKEVSQWCRYYFENEPKVAAAINFYAMFPMNGFENECPDPKIKMYFDNTAKRLNLDHWTQMISHEHFLIGDVFPFTEFECSICGGSGVDPNNPGVRCRHPKGTIKRILVLNPDWIDVQWNILADEPVITLTPDDELRRIVLQKTPRQIYDKLPINVRNLVATGQPIPLSNRAVKHLKHNASPYQTYGTSLIRRLFKTLAYKDKLMTAQWIVAERMILPIRVVKVGNDERPAGPQDIADMQAQLGAVANDPNLTLVTHHAFEYDWYGASGKTIQISNELEYVSQEVLDGVMLNQALLNGEMGSYSGLAIGVETMIQRMDNWRLQLKRWIEECIYKPIAQMQGFVDEEASAELGETVYLYPKIRWNDLNLRDKNQEIQNFMQLHEKQIISAETLCEKVNVDYDQEVERIRFEQATMSMMAPGADGGMGGMGGGFGGGGAPLGGDMGGGGMPPLDGAPDMGMAGDMGAPDMGAPDLGGMDMGAPPTAASVPAEQKIMKPEKRRKLERQSNDEKEGVQENKIIQFTSIEKKMYKGLMQSKIPYRKFAQFEAGPYKLDFAFPDLKIAVECDGEAFHSSPSQLERDQERDSKLAQAGWTVLRFKDKEIDDRFGAVINKIVDTINKKAQMYREQMSKKGK